MLTINVEGMHCGKCVARIEAAMEQDGIKGAVSLENHTVQIEEEGRKEEMLELLDDLGFEGSIA